MDNPKVSIIVPIYRVEEYIERCAESLFAQTFDDIEYIFVDDCSPDKSVEILQRTLEKYPHRKRLTRIERLSSNSGQAAVRRQGIQLASGDYTVHCDSDDWMDVHANYILLPYPAITIWSFMISIVVMVFLHMLPPRARFLPIIKTS